MCYKCTICGLHCVKCARYVEVKDDKPFPEEKKGSCYNATYDNMPLDILYDCTNDMCVETPLCFRGKK